MKNYLLYLLILLILSIIVLVDYNLVCLIILLILLTFIVIIPKNFRYKFIFIYILLLLFIAFILFKENNIYGNFYEEKFKVIEVKKNYYIISNYNDKFILYKNDLLLQEGNIIEITGKYESIREQGVPYLFDFSKYCKYQNIKGIINISSYKLIDDNVTLRSKIISWLLNDFNYSKERLEFILFGINNIKIDEFYDILVDLSLIHLFVISGYHFQFLYLILKKIIKFDYIILPILFFYLYLLNFSLSALRAFLFLLFKKIDKNKKYSRLAYLSMIALIFIINNPYVIFLTSFILTFSLSFFIELITIISIKKKKHISMLLWGILPYISILPIIIEIQGKFSVYHILIQSLITPFIPILYILSFIVVFIKKLDFYYFQIFYGIENIFKVLESNISYITYIKITDAFIVFYYCLLILFFKNMYLRKKQKSIIIIYTLCLTFFGYNYFPYNNPTIYFLDVGQGDSILIRGKNNSYNILIDTGGNIYKDIALSVHIPLFNKLGIKHLDAIFISHNDYDHCGALTTILNNICVEKVINNNFDTHILFDLIFYNLNCDIDDDWDDNAKSQILYFKFLDNYFLLTGDMTKMNEEIFIKRGMSLKVDILKVSHHGSDTSTTEEFLDFIKPNIAIISVGINNKYGHPSFEVISRLNKRNIDIYRTDEMGTIILTKNKSNKLKIYKTIIN